MTRLDTSPVASDSLNNPFHQWKGPGVVTQWPSNSTPPHLGQKGLCGHEQSIEGWEGRHIKLYLYVYFISFLGIQEDIFILCVYVCLCDGWHRWLWSKDVINTQGKGISIQKWAPCFSGEVIGKKFGRTGRGTDTHPQANTQTDITLQHLHVSYSFPYYRDTLLLPYIHYFIIPIKLKLGSLFSHDLKKRTF